MIHPPLRNERRVVAAARVAGFLAFTAIVALLAASLCGCATAAHEFGTGLGEPVAQTLGEKLDVFVEALLPGFEIDGGGDRRVTRPGFTLGPERAGGANGSAQDVKPSAAPPIWTDANLLGALGTGIGTIALAFWVRWNSYRVQKPEWEAQKKLMRGIPPANEES